MTSSCFVVYYSLSNVFRNRIYTLFFMKCYQHLLRFRFAFFKKNLYFSFTLYNNSYFVIIKLTFRTNFINTSVCTLVDKDINHIQRIKNCHLWHCAPSYYGPYESTYRLTVYTPLLRWHHCWQFIISVCLSQKIFFPVICRIAKLNEILKYIFEIPCISGLRYGLFPSLDFTNAIF